MILSIPTEIERLADAKSLLSDKGVELGITEEGDNITRIAEAFSTFDGYASIDNYKRDMKMVAHRGYSDNVPENTLQSVGFAGELGYWGCEIDICETADGQFVLMHDDTVDRTTDGTGSVINMTLAEIQELKINTHDMYQSTVQYVRVPTLEEYLEVCLKYDMHPVIELKTIVGASSVEKLVDIVDKYTKDYTIITFTESYAVKARELRANIGVHLLVTSPTTANVQTCADNNFAISGSYKNCTVDATWVVLAKELGVELAVWTLNDQTVLEDYRELGVKYITTDMVIDYYDARVIGKLCGLSSVVSAEGGNWSFGGYQSKGYLFPREGQNVLTSNGNLNRAKVSNIVRVAGCNQFMVKGLDPTYRTSALCFDATGRMLKDLGWLTTGVLYELKPSATYMVVYASRADNADMVDTEFALLSDIRMVAWHNRVDASVVYIEEEES